MVHPTVRRMASFETTGPDHMAQLIEGCQWLREVVPVHAEYHLNIARGQSGFVVRVSWTQAKVEPIETPAPAWYEAINRAAH